MEDIVKGIYNTPINRHWNRKEVVFEVSIVEKAGVIPAKVQIERLIRAGENLINYRKEQYDYGVDYESDPDPDLDVRVRQPSIDLAEVTEIKNKINENMKKTLESMQKYDKMNDQEEENNVGKKEKESDGDD